jgi:GntR family transcriptional regulator, transcriptional repressor for pyruvate dehydrogenase complex
VNAGRGSVPAYQVLADALRARIMTGALKPGEKLPIEPDLSTQYGVSRSTVREALRVLASQNLITTTRGVSGGSFVAHPHPEQISVFLESSIRLLTQADGVTIAELAEARDLLEVPASGLAAVRRSAAQLEQLKQTLFSSADVTPERAIELNKAFHTSLMRASGSPLVEVLVRPVFEVIYDHVVGFDAPEHFWSDLDGDHDRIYAAVAAGDPVSTQEATRDHLRKLRPALA